MYIYTHTHTRNRLNRKSHTIYTYCSNTLICKNTKTKRTAVIE